MSRFFNIQGLQCTPKEIESITGSFNAIARILRRNRNKFDPGIAAEKFQLLTTLKAQIKLELQKNEQTTRTNRRGNSNDKPSS